MVRTAGGADDAASPGPMRRASGGGRHDRPFDTLEYPLAERRAVPGLHPDRAPTIVAGTILLAQVLEAFGLDRFEASERDILWGVAIAAAP